MKRRRLLPVLLSATAMVLAGCGTIQEAIQVATPIVAGEIEIRSSGFEPVTWTPDLRVQPTRWRVNEMRDVSGSLDVSCNLGNLSLEGSVEVSHCH